MFVRQPVASVTIAARSPESKEDAVESLDQGAFDLGDFLKTFHKTPATTTLFRSLESAMSDTAHWNERYEKGETPWDTGQPSSELLRVLAESAVPPGRALE